MRPNTLSHMAIDFGSLKAVRQDLPKLMDMDGNQAGENCKYIFELDFAPRPKYLMISLQYQQLVLKSPLVEDGADLD